ncbi:protein nervous wreck isoform X2 [Thrips palmi]|uniref:Protein nervous wreck isoform X2 n=1 Tax=Thrips palmi TaxID=161013 RepID=A0A6P9AAA5_THRPL|nr:protein nervous wreck isoform X2 [Thrips palmi]
MATDVHTVGGRAGRVGPYQRQRRWSSRSLAPPDETQSDSKAGNYAKFLKNLHSEQLAKLQAKNQHECELLEDLRSFIIKRSAIERSYSEALLKISSAFLNKKIPNIPDIKTEGGEEKWNMWNVWRTVLEENEKLARARLAAVEVFQQNVIEDAKTLRSHKLQVARKTIDHLAVVQKELQTTVVEVDKTKKFYFDEEHSAHDVRDKAKDIEEKLKKKKGSFFQSITSLQKNSAKVTSKREQLEEKSTGARNDYLLSLASANAHQTRYFLVDLQSAMATMESAVYDKVAEYLMMIGRTELLTCSATQHSFGRIRDQALQLTREYNLQCVYLFYPVLKQHIQYEFEPCDDDTVTTVTAEHSTASTTLSKEARRWSNRIARENHSIRECSRKLIALQQLKDQGQKTDPNDQNGPDIETKMEELRQTIRRAETAKVKAEARIECLRKGGVNVEEWLEEADYLDPKDVPRSTSSLSVHTDASGTGEPHSDSFYDSDYTEGEGERNAPRSGSTSAAAQDYEDDEEERPDSTEVDAMLEQERQRIEQLTAGWDDPTAAWGAEETEDAATAAVAAAATERPVGMAGNASGPTYKCIALYSYTAQNPDELTIVENEQLEVVGEGDGDGWLCARNYRGEEGFVPSNYLDVDREATGGGLQAGASNYQLSNQISFSSVDYTVAGEGDGVFPGDAGAAPAAPAAQTQEEVAEVYEPPAMPPPAMPPPAAPPAAAHPAHPVPVPLNLADRSLGYCVAMYDYEATCAEELSFSEGEIVHILRKVVHDDVDDGWWEGEIHGQKGLFPSLVVEECHANGDPITPSEDETPPMSAPPVFTPPEAPPSFMLAPQQVIVTQATPMVENADDAKDEPAPVEPPASASAESKKFSFSMEMEGSKYKKYDSQFVEGSAAPQGPPGVPIVTIAVDGEDDEVPVDEAGGGDDPGLCVASIVITCATPCVEEADGSFPPPPEGDGDGDTEEEAATEREAVPGSSTGSEESITTDNSQSQAPTAKGAKKVVESPDEVPEDDEPPPLPSGAGVKAEVPEDLEPHQLEKLQGLKESDA